MHPNPAFRAENDIRSLEAAAAIGFAHIVVVTDQGPMVVHAPVTQAGSRLQFHVARGNRATAHLDGATVLVSVVGAHGYVSPNWYVDHTNQVPTWNYDAIEIDGVAHAIDDAALVEQLDALARFHEPRVNPDNPWSQDKMDETVFARMRGGIRGFEVAVTAIRGTTKLSQNKSPGDRIGIIAGLNACGNTDLAEAMA
ncbi:FMN-binding negative transcriptional regulator [Sphingomonas sp. R86521]|uniref:FMN-binding negative transcriptional regulator n=1 Tax=Sphingomonas sp. R86521 TaxID=3093860 RepID=UPI0036D3668B